MRNRERREDGPVKMEAENGMMPPETKECLEDQKLEEIENDSPQSRGRGAWPVNPLISDFGYRIVREYISGENSAGKVVVVCMAALGK